MDKENELNSCYSVCKMHRSISSKTVFEYEIIYEFIETIKEAELLAQLEMSKKSFTDLIFIFPGSNLSIDSQKPELYKKALELAEKYKPNAD